VRFSAFQCVSVRSFVERNERDVWCAWVSQTSKGEARARPRLCDVRQTRARALTRIRIPADPRAPPFFATEEEGTKPTDTRPSRRSDAASARFARRSGSRPAVTDVVWDADGATRAVRRARDPPRGERGRSEDADDRGRLKRGKRRPKPMGASSVRDERGTDAPADLRPRLCGSSSSATPCLRGGAPSRPLDRHSVTGRHRSPPPEALSRGAVRWPLPASTRVLTAPRAARSPPKTPPAGPYAAGDDLPSRLPRARDSGAATAADTPVSSDRGLGGFVGGDDRT